MFQENKKKTTERKNSQSFVYILDYLRVAVFVFFLHVLLSILYIILLFFFFFL